MQAISDVLNELQQRLDWRQKLDKCDRLFGDSQKKSRNLKIKRRMFGKLIHLNDERF
jgi:hypothetical protein